MATIPNSDTVRVPKTLLLTITLMILVVLTLAFTVGCRDKIEASAYSGSFTVFTTLGSLTVEDNERRTVVFGDSGLPVDGGREAFVGQVIKLGGGSAKITSVFTVGPTVTVEYDVIVQLGTALLTGTKKDVYTLVGRNKLTVIVHSETIATNDDGVSAKFVSEGTLVKDLL